MSEDQPEDLIERALTFIRREQQARRLQRAAGGDSGGSAAPSAARFRYLDALEDAGTGRTISDIGEAIGVDRPRASRLTTELLKDGLIERRPHPGDARYVLASITAEGTAIVNEMRRARQDAVTRALAGFTPQEARTFAGLLQRFVTAWPQHDSRND